jgi:hypothetical protein
MLLQVNDLALPLCKKLAQSGNPAYNILCRSRKEPQYRASIGIDQRRIYGKDDPETNWNVPQYNDGEFRIYNTNKKYRLRKVR